MKIAICFFGILGGIEGKNGKGASKPIIEISKKYYNQNIFTEDTDVFMHTWSKDYKTEILNAFSPKFNRKTKKIKNSEIRFCHKNTIEKTTKKQETKPLQQMVLNYESNGCCTRI